MKDDLKGPFLAEDLRRSARLGFWARPRAGWQRWSRWATAAQRGQTWRDERQFSFLSGFPLVAT